MSQDFPVDSSGVCTETNENEGGKQAVTNPIKSIKYL